MRQAVSQVRGRRICHRNVPAPGAAARPAFQAPGTRCASGKLFSRVRLPYSAAVRCIQGPVTATRARAAVILRSPIRSLLIRCCLGGLLLWATASSSDPELALEDARRAFLAAEQALAAGDRAAFQRLLKALESYPLQPYLVYANLRRRLGAVPAEEIERFLAAQNESYLADSLRHAWLERLAARGAWEQFLAVYRDTDDVPPSATRAACGWWDTRSRRSAIRYSTPGGRPAASTLS
jgi:hypothetical protein